MANGYEMVVWFDIKVVRAILGDAAYVEEIRILALWHLPLPVVIEPMAGQAVERLHV